MKEKRQRTISQIINYEIIRNQEELVKSLADKGIFITQATLSRDMKALRIVKKHDKDNRYVYALPDETTSTGQETVDSETLSVEFSGNLAVVKTRPGYAMAVAFEIDKHNPREIAGTIAGDDTILIIPREGFSREQVAFALANHIK
jgi:transcriptional regulator of arginine metabolism